MGSTSRQRLSRRIGAYIASALVALGATASADMASDPGVGDSRPASPEDGRVAVSSLFRFPDDFSVRDETTTIICQVLVGRTGEVSARKCGQHGGSERLRAWVRNEIHQRLKRARFRPALVDGARVSVSMPLRAQISCDAQGDCAVAVHPNAGVHTATYGDDYFAPQEIISDGGTWYDRLVASDDCRSGQAYACKNLDAFAFGASVRVGEDGLVNGVGQLAGVEAGEFPVEAALGHLAEARYIPARVQGEAVQLLVHTPTIHKENSRHFPRNQCRRVDQIGTRLGINCFTMQELAAHRPDDESGFAEALAFWLGAGNSGG